MLSLRTFPGAKQQIGIISDKRKEEGKKKNLRKFFFHFRIENSLQEVLGDLSKVQEGWEYKSSGCQWD